MHDFNTRFMFTMNQLIADCQDGNEEAAMTFMPHHMIDLEELVYRACQLNLELTRFSWGLSTREDFINALERSEMFENYFIDEVRELV